jgi:manganese/zinc/iron transport system permease protein
MDYNTAIVFWGVATLGVTAGVVGSFMVLRRRALAGDALAHASLPGLVGAFLLFERRELLILLAGALVSGLVGIGVVAILSRYTRTKEDASIGIVLSVFFGLGIVMSRFVQNRTTAGSKAGLDSFLLGKTAGIIAQDVEVILVVSMITLAVVLLLFKELKLVTYDQGFAQVQGWPTVGLDLCLLGLVAVNVMIGLPAVGVVLVAALLILPAAAARFWTDRLGRMVLLAALLGGGIGMVGTLLSASFSGLPAGPTIVLTGTVVLLVSMLASPKRGLIAKSWRDFWWARGIEQRCLLQEIYEETERGGGQPPRRQDVVHRSSESWALARLMKSGWVKEEGGSVQITADGMRRAEEIVLGSRLWQAYLEEYPDQAGPLADLSHESVDGILPMEMVDDLKKLVRSQGRWPALSGAESAGRLP